MVDKLVMLVLCALLLVLHRGDVTATEVIVPLVALCCASLGEWLLSTWPSRSWMPVAAMPLAALFVPTLAFVLPVVAYDAARVPAAGAIQGARDARMGLSIVARYAWAFPVAIVLLRRPDDRMASSIVALLAFIGFAWGARTRDAASLDARLHDSLDRNRAMVRDLRSRLTDAQENRAEAARIATLNERTRIARDIHDNVGHLLTRAIMQTEAERVVAESRGDALAAKRFAEVGASVKEAMTMVRRAVHDLDDAGVDFAAWIADAARSTGRLHVELRNTVAAGVPAPVARCLAAVIRESLANAARHGMADEVTVTVQDFPAFWQLVVQDNGNTPAAMNAVAAQRPAAMWQAEAADGRGMGLADIEARVRALDGTCAWGPDADGWRVFVSIPKTATQGGTS